MRQQSLADEGFERYRKPTRRDQFLAEMDQIILWRDLCKVIKPFYPNPKGAGRPPSGLERMLRIHFLQHWFNLSDPAVEEALYDSRDMRRFVGIDLGREPALDETTVCNFRHLLEAHNLGSQLFTLSKVRVKVEYLFLILKRVLGFNEVCYSGLENATRLFVACGVVNLHMVRRRLLRPT